MEPNTSSITSEINLNVDFYSVDLFALKKTSELFLLDHFVLNHF